jgi:RNA-binding protein
MILTGKQKRFLRAKAHHITPLFQIGKNGVTDNLITQLVDLLEKRELIKVNILQNCLQPKEEVAQQLADQTNAAIVQVIGNHIILYKASTENKEIQLP